MKDSFLSSSFVVETPLAGAIFASSRMRRILMMFAAEPLSLKEAASRSGIELKRLHYYVQRLLALGLIEVASVRPRAGREVKMYRSIARSFFVPNEVLPRPSTDELNQELRHLLERDESRASIGILVSLGAHLEPKVELVGAGAGRREGFELWRILRLKSDAFGQLRDEIDAILARYQNVPDDRGQVYLVYAAAAARAHHEGVVDNPGQRKPGKS